MAGPDLLWRVTLAWQRRVASALKPLDLTHPQFVLLTVTDWLTGQEGPPTQRRIADHAGTDPMTTSQVLRTLEACSSASPGPSDARAKGGLRTTHHHVAAAVPALDFRRHPQRRVKRVGVHRQADDVVAPQVMPDYQILRCSR